MYARKLAALVLITFCFSAYSGNDISEMYDALSSSYNTAIASGDYRKAIECANEQLGMDPSDPEAFMRLSLAVRLMGDSEKAKRLMGEDLEMVAEGPLASDPRMKGLAKALLEDTLRVNPAD